MMRVADNKRRLHSRHLLLAIALAGVAAAGATSARAAQLDSCRGAQDVPIDSHRDWRCELTLVPGQAYVVRARQDAIDVSVEILGPDALRIAAVNAPIRRAMSELVLVGPGLNGRHVVVVRSVDRDSLSGTVPVSLEEIKARSDSTLMSGLRRLTLAAALSDDNSKKNAKQRIETLNAALPDLRAAGAQDLVASALLRIAGIYYWSLDDYPNSARFAGEAMTAFERVPDPILQSQAAMQRGAALLEVANAIKGSGRRGTEISEFDEAKRILEQAAQRFHAAGRAFDEALAINYRGIADFYQDDTVAARPRFVQAARMFKSMGANVTAALPLANLAYIDWSSGDYARAVESYDALLQVRKGEDGDVTYVTLLLNSATAQYAIGEYDRALQSYFDAQNFCARYGFTSEQARSLFGLGNVYLTLGERVRGEQFLDQALTLRRRIGDPRGLQASLLKGGDVKREDGDVRGALKMHLEALDRALTVTQKARAFHSIGLDHEAGNAFPAAMAAFDSALKLDLPPDWPVRVSVLGAYGRTKMQAGDATGRDMVLQAAQLHKKRGDLDLAAQEYFALALEDQRTAKLDSALANVQEALSLYESQRLRAINPDLRGSYLASRAEAFELEGDLFMSLSERARGAAERKRYEDQALLANEANRLRLMADFRDSAQANSSASNAVSSLEQQLAARRLSLGQLMEQENPSSEVLANLRNEINLLRTRRDMAQSNDASSGKAAVAPQSVAAIQATIAPDTAVLVYQLGGQRSWLWVVTRQSVNAYVLQGRREVEQAACDLYDTWKTPNPSAMGLERERAASRTILGSTLTGTLAQPEIAVVADGILRTLPFGALWVDGANRSPARLADSHAVTFRATLSAALPRTELAQAREPNRILLIGDPTGSDASEQTAAATRADPSWQPLPGARKEVQSIAEIARQWRSYVLLGAQATKPAVLAMPLDSFRAIHFATHARFDAQDPQLSAIVLSSRDKDRVALASTLTLREILGFRLQAETVVLSACEASLGKSYRGQLSFGLSEAFLVAGAQNVLGSVWRVSDDAAQAYMRIFYEQYILHDATPAQAAQMAARTLSQDPVYSQPYFWAAFVLAQR